MSQKGNCPGAHVSLMSSVSFNFPRISKDSSSQKPTRPLCAFRRPSAGPSGCQKVSHSIQWTKKSFRNEVFDQCRFPFGLRDAKDAKSAAEKMEPAERKLLFDALRKSMADQYNEHKRLGNAVIHSDDYVRLWYIYFIPHLALGTTHSATFIFFGEQLQGFGAQYGLSVMWAAAVGNVISNVLMLNFNKQVESVMEYVGYKRPILSAEQMHNQEVRTVSFAGKMIGVLFGSMLGLFPLLIYEHPVDKREKINKRTCKSPNYARSFQEEAACQYVQAVEDQERLEQRTERRQRKQIKESSPEDLLQGAPPEVDGE